MPAFEPASRSATLECALGAVQAQWDLHLRVLPAVLRPSGDRSARPASRAGGPHAVRSSTFCRRRKRNLWLAVLQKGRVAAARTPLRGVPRLLRRPLPAQARLVGRCHARRKSEQSLRGRASPGGPDHAPLRGRRAAVRVAHEVVLPGAQRTAAQCGDQPRRQLALSHAGAQTPPPAGPAERPPGQLRLRRRAQAGLPDPGADGRFRGATSRLGNALRVAWPRPRRRGSHGSVARARGERRGPAGPAAGPAIADRRLGGVR